MPVDMFFMGAATYDCYAGLMTVFYQEKYINNSKDMTAVMGSIIKAVVCGP